MGNLIVELNAEDWAIKAINLRVTDVNLQEKAWIQGTGGLQSPHWKITKFMGSTQDWISRRIYQDPLSPR